MPPAWDSRVLLSPDDYGSTNFSRRNSVTVSSGYFNRAVNDFDTIIAEAVSALAGEDYDTLVGTGLSGALVVPNLARAVDKNWLIVRKPDDGTHGDRRGEGTLGKRWIFVDDFIESGATLDRVTHVIDSIVGNYNWDGFDSVHVGTYLYQHTYDDVRYERTPLYKVTPPPPPPPPLSDSAAASLYFVQPPRIKRHAPETLPMVIGDIL